MGSEGEVATLRIGELARRTGVSPELLRAWEQRYGLLRPSRSQGGFRLYSEADERRVRATTVLIGQGLSAAEAAGRALRGDVELTAARDEPIVRELAAELGQALDRFETERVHALFDRLLSTVSVETLMVDVVVPYLRTLGDRWERGTVSVAQEHFASNLLRGRLMGLARDWSLGSGPSLVLACPPGEEHDLGLIMFGIAVSRRGRRVVFLGANTPLETVRETVATTHPAAVVLAVTRPESLGDQREALVALASDVPLLLCGSGAGSDEAASVGAEVLAGDPIQAARTIAG